MPSGAPWRCARCATLNLASAEACRACGAAPEIGAAPRTYDHAGLAGILSLLLPGLGQLYTARPRRAAVLLGLPVLVAASVAMLLVIDPLRAAALRAAVGFAAAGTALLAAYHAGAVLDAFAAPSTRGAGIRGKRTGEYATLALLAVALALLYLALLRASTAWAALAERVFEPSERGASAASWTGGERLNVLLLGIDTRPGHERESQNTDTIIVLTVDPLNTAAGMLSVPRDTLVPIEGHGEDKINAAFALGGPDLARKTVSQLLSVPIHAYSLVDFAGFRRVVDALGGLVVDTPVPVRDEGYPTDDFGVTRIHIRAGPQLMDSETALRYARSRHDSNDFSRAERQQRVIAAAKRTVGESGDLLRLASLVDELSDAVRTDLDPLNALRLLRFALSVPEREVERAVLRAPSDVGPGELRELNRDAGYYLVPVRAAIARLVAELFYEPRVRAEAARVEVRAPSARPALGQELGADLARRRYRVARVVATADERRTTVILSNPEKRYSAEQLAKAVGATLARGSADPDVDVVLVIGDDFRGLAAGNRP